MTILRPHLLLAAAFATTLAASPSALAQAPARWAIECTLDAAAGGEVIYLIIDEATRTAQLGPQITVPVRITPDTLAWEKPIAHSSTGGIAHQVDRRSNTLTVTRIEAGGRRSQVSGRCTVQR